MKQISPVELGKRLASARRDRHMSQEEVARHLDVSRPTLVAIEKGDRAVRPEELILLAQLYGRSVHSLVHLRERSVNLTPVFRATQVADIETGAVTEAQTVFQRACEDYLMLEDLMNAPLSHYHYPEPYPTDGLSVEAAAEEVATLERARLNLGLGPLPNLFETLENEVGLRVFVLPLKEFRLAGMFAYTDRLGGCILVNGQHPRTRQHWSMAHEYAHFLTDRFREDIAVLFEYERKPRAEQFADSFAACFLMPAPGLRQRFRRIVKSQGDFMVADLYLLAEQYAVSVEAMARRLESLGCVRAGIWERLTARGLDSARMRAHLGLTPMNRQTVRLPERYLRLAVQAFEDEKITESELARLLRCSRVEAREVVNRMIRPEGIAASGETYQLDLNFGDRLELPSTER